MEKVKSIKVKGIAGVFLGVMAFKVFIDTCIKLDKWGEETRKEKTLKEAIEAVKVCEKLIKKCDEFTKSKENQEEKGEEG